MIRFSRRLRIAATAGALSLGLAGAASAREMDCPNVEKRVAFVFEHEFCALESGVTEGELGSYLAQKIAPRSYRTRWEKVPKSERERLAKVLGRQPGDSEEVALVEAIPPGWLSKVGTALHSGDQMVSGGGFVGGVLRFCMVDGQDGHHEVTNGVAIRSGWSKTAAGLLASASRDADVYEWNEPAAHAQTPNEAAAPFRPGPQSLARQAFGDKIVQYVTSIERSCSAGRPAEALYILGYLLHAVQDLSTHAGQTNAEHSYRTLMGENPDAKANRIRRSRLWTKEALDRFATGECAKQMKKVSNNATVKGSALFGPKDGTAKELAEFEWLGIQYYVALQAQSVSPGTFWFPADDESEARTFFETEVLKRIDNALGTSSGVVAGAQ